MSETTAKVNVIKGDGQVLAYASVHVHRKLVIRDMRVMAGEDGPWVAFPGKKGNDGRYYDTVFATDRSLRDEIRGAVLAEYERVRNGGTADAGGHDEEAPF